MWGFNGSGQIGDHHETGILKPTMLDFGTACEKDDAIVDIKCGAMHTAAVSQSGRVFTWGRASNGRLGRKPLNADEIAAMLRPKRLNLDRFSGTNADGSPVAWNTFQDNIHEENREVQFCANILPVEALDSVPTRAVALGGFHSLSLAQDGHVWSWGGGGNGELGTGNLEDSLNPREVGVPVSIM